MKRIITLVSAIAMVAAIVACEKGPTPDGSCALKNITLTKALNPALNADLTGKINGNTVVFNIPTDAIGTNLIPTFTVTEFDEVKIGGIQAESGVTSCKFTDGTKIEVSDDVSALNAIYTVTVNENDGQAVLLSLSISKNSELSIAEDIKASEISEEMVLRVPGSAFQKNLTVKATAGKNDIIKINGEVAGDGSATVDTKFPVDIEVVDEFAGAKQSYVLKVGKILENVWELAATYSNEYLTGYLDLAVDGANDVPYIAVQENSVEVDDKGKSLVKSLPTVIKLEGGSLVPVGNQRILNVKCDYNAIDVIDGIPYIAFTDGGSATKNRVSVMSYKGGTWDFVGERGSIAKVTGVSKYKVNLTLDPGTKNPIVAVPASENIGSVAKRDASISIFDGKNWNANTNINGRTQTDSYTQRVCRSADAAYVLTENQTDKSFTLFQYKSNGWTAFGNPVRFEGATDVCSVFMDVACDLDGTPYIAVGDNSSGDYLLKLFKYDGSDLKMYGNVIPGATFNDTNCQWAITFAKDNTPIVAYIPNSEGDGHKVKVVMVDPETKAWSGETILGEGVNGGFLATGRADNGTVYVAFSKTVEATTTIYLYKYKLEDDILPE